MKKCLPFLLAIASASAFAATPANFYEHKGTTASASYVTQSHTGTTLTITLNGTTYTAHNQEIHDDPTVLGP